MTNAATSLSPAGSKAALAEFLRREAGAATVDIDACAQLAGGAIQENWKLTARIEGGPFAGSHELVLRTDSASYVPVSRPRWQEFGLLQVARRAGVRVPEPLWLDDTGTVFGKPFYLMRFVPGTAEGHRLVKEGAIADPEALTEELGAQLAKLHAVKPPVAELDFLGPPPDDTARRDIDAYRAYLDGLEHAYPTFEWGLRWCELHAPEPGESVLLHRDFRTGNYLVQDGRLVAVLDWEFADWGDPMSDIGWFCAQCWRFGRGDRQAGGIGSRATFYRGYEEGSGRAIDPRAIEFWEVMAHLRWAIIALQQGARYTRDGEVSLDLALTGRIRPDELGYAILTMTAPERWRPE
jgi:aminoglycoside phosphotransferase (APT) family kinase protein